MGTAKKTEHKKKKPVLTREQEREERIAEQTRMLDGILGWLISGGLFLVAALYLFIGIKKGYLNETLVGVLYATAAALVLPPGRRRAQHILGRRITPMMLILLLSGLFVAALAIGYTSDQKKHTEKTVIREISFMELNPYLAPASKSGLYWGYINIKGEFHIKERYRNAWPFENGRAVVELEDGSLVWIDAKGDLLPGNATKPQDQVKVDTASAPGLVPTAQGGFWGFAAQADGRMVIAPNYKHVKPFSTITTSR